MQLRTILILISNYEGYDGFWSHVTVFLLKQRSHFDTVVLEYLRMCRIIHSQSHFKYIDIDSFIYQIAIENEVDPLDVFMYCRTQL